MILCYVVSLLPSKKKSNSLYYEGIDLEDNDIGIF